jgi:hypothetical protein
MTTHDQRAFWGANLLIARAMMQRIDPDQVNLNDWRDPASVEMRAGVQYEWDEPTCGTIACFGGWCAWEPAFRELGVRSNHHGAPVIDEGCARSGLDVAQYLFGDEAMFCPAMRGDIWPGVEDYGTTLGVPRVPDHQIVLNRIEKRLKELA